ncbi:hypothetical protein EVAR_40757_1 [Eumeta japonica]|uniref:Uncharacterized protein n=1 Tax=Eumeta variegata TaxID=151549 RepID=A0A4C1X3G5_EUMVA|nr:hypothetical protein EVAR_40757_1 [Eumeta japonica]
MIRIDKNAGHPAPAPPPSPPLHASASLQLCRQPRTIEIGATAATGRHFRDVNGNETTYLSSDRFDISRAPLAPLRPPWRRGEPSKIEGVKLFNFEPFVSTQSEPGTVEKCRLTNPVTYNLSSDTKSASPRIRARAARQKHHPPLFD